MGWRVSWYSADKNEPLKCIIEEDGSETIEINGECVSNNNGTDFWLKLKYDEDFKKEITCLKEYPVIDYYSITKKGFQMIILEYRKHIINYMKEYLESFKKLDFNNDKEIWKGSDLILDYERELREWQSSYKESDNETHYFNIKFKEKEQLGLSGSWLYKYAIFDMLEVYKYFDWDNKIMVVYGG